MPLCPICESEMIKRIAFKGTENEHYFWGCSNFPRCRGTRDCSEYEKEDITITTEISKEVLCPVCNSKMIKRIAGVGTENEHYFWGCSNFPKCRGTRNFTEAENNAQTIFWDKEEAGFLLNNLESFVIKDKVFVTSGLIENDEKIFNEFIVKNGGIVNSSIVKATDYLVINTRYRSKSKEYLEALELKDNGSLIKIISLSDIAEKFGLLFQYKRSKMDSSNLSQQAKSAKSRLNSYYRRLCKEDKTAYSVLRQLNNMTEKELISLASEKGLVKDLVKSNNNGPFSFVSYAHKDMVKIQKILQQMQSEGYRFWYDEGIEPGDEWDDILATNIERCEAFIAFISKNYLNSENCKNELRFAQSNDKKKLLVFLDDSELSPGMKMNLSSRQAIYKKDMLDVDFYLKLFSCSDLNNTRKE